MKPLISDAPGYPLHALLYEADRSDTLLVALPGGAANRTYFDLAPDHSFARRVKEAGFDCLIADHPGTASNPRPSDDFISPRAAVDELALALQSWSVGYETIIGVGHSMGGMMITLLQARHNLFDAISLMGSSTGGLAWGLNEKARTYIDAPVEKIEADLEALTLDMFGSPWPPNMGGPNKTGSTFGGETDELTQALRDVSCGLFAAGGMMSMIRGSFTPEAEAIRVPMLFVFGDNDIGQSPDKAPDGFPNAARTDVIVLPDTGHNHFAYSSFDTLMPKFNAWVASIRERSQ